MEIPTVPANEWTATQLTTTSVCAQQRLSNGAPNRVPNRAPDSAQNTVWKKLWLCCGLLLSVFSARAEAPTPPREFWDYMMEFSDDNGEVFDPADLAVTEKIGEKIKEKTLTGNVSEYPSTNSSSGPAVGKGAAVEESKAVGEKAQ
jgi:hypothetical protein